MASKKSENIDIINILKGLSPEERREISQQAESLVEDDEIEQSLRVKNLVKITDFNDAKVLPYVSGAKENAVHNSVLGKNCVFSVYNKKTGGSILLTGDKLTRLFDDNDETNLFKAKKLGANFTVRHYKVRFSHLNYEE